MGYTPPRTRVYLDELTRISMKALREALTPPDHPDANNRLAVADYPGVGRIAVSTAEVCIGPARVPLVWKPANLGSYQAYFQCPACGAKRMHLYSVAVVRWVCRTCTGAHGRVHSLEPLPRIERAIAKLNARLERPNVNGHRGMGATTRQALIRRRLELEAKQEALTVQRLRALLRRLDPSFDM